MGREEQAIEPDPIFSTAEGLFTLHILLITSYFPSPKQPITGIFFHDQARSLQNAGYQVGVIVVPRLNVTIETARARRRLQALTHETTFAEFPVYRMHWGWFPRVLPPVANALTNLAGEGAFRTYCAAHGTPDVIHAHNIFYAGTLAAHLKRRAHIPTVLTEHSSSYLEGLIIFPGQKPIIRSILREMDVPLAVGGTLARALEEYVPGKPVQVVGNMVDTDFFTISRAPLPDDFTFAAIGRMDKNKAFNVLLEGFHRAFAGQNVRLLMAGDGPMRPELEQYVQENGLGEQVRFLGWLSRPQVRDVLQNSHAALLSSNIETFGLVLVEAMCCGKPVISTRSGGPNDYVDATNGLLTPPGDVDAFAAALQQMVASYPQYDTERVRASCVGRYSEAVYIARLEAAYRSAIYKN